MEKCLICKNIIKDKDMTYSVTDIIMYTDGKCHKECGDRYKEKSLSSYEIKDGLNDRKIQQNIPRTL